MKLGVASGAGTLELEAVVEKIAEGAAARDMNPAFPAEAFKALYETGVLTLPAPGAEPGSDRRRGSFGEEWQALRKVAGADASVGRILDGHLNGVERIAALTSEPLRSADLQSIVRGELLLGVWGADPIPDEGPPARLAEHAGRMVIEGVKTYCSGATGLDRALITVHPHRDSLSRLPLFVYLALDETVEIDRGWYKGSGMRASESHRVIFHQTPVLAVLGEPGELTREPFFARDAVRTAAVWAGIMDRAVDEVLAALANKPGEPDEIISLAAGRMLVAQKTVDRWMEHAACFADENPRASLAGFTTELRWSVAEACREVLEQGARACGSRPFVTGSALDRVRRDLELFLLQHRLEPAISRVGRGAILADKDRGRKRYV